MTDTMLERTGAEILSAIRPYLAGDLDSTDVATLKAEAARAALEAIRSPTKAMTDAAWDEAQELTLRPESAWPAMIDAILSEIPPNG